MTTKSPESAASQMKRLDHAVEAELVNTIKDGTDAIAKADERIARQAK